MAFISNFYEFWGGTTKKKGSLLQNLRKKRFLLPNPGVTTSILKVSGLKLHSGGTERVTFFGAQSSLGGTRFSFEGAQPRKAYPVTQGLVMSFFWSSPIDVKRLYTELQ